MNTLTITANNLDVLNTLEMFNNTQVGSVIAFDIANIKIDLTLPEGMQLGDELQAYITSIDYANDVILSSDEPEWLDHLNTLVDLYRNTLRVKLKDVAKSLVHDVKDSIKYASHEVAMQIGRNGHNIKNCIKISTYVLTLGHYLTDPNVRRIYKSSSFLGKIKIDVMPILLEQVALAGVDACVKYTEGYDKAKAESDSTLEKANQE